MLNPLYLERKSDTPAIKLLPEGNWSIIGRSLPENAEKVYKPLIEWVEQYVAAGGSERTTLTLELEYFNSSSVKQILSMLLLLEDLHKQGGKQVEIIWSYNHDDELMEMKGRELESLVELPFVMQAFTV